ncbi:hypothetical protein NRIC0776_10530 [Apilactobacillus kunkeei]
MLIGLNLSSLFDAITINIKLDAIEAEKYKIILIVIDSPDDLNIDAKRKHRLTINHVEKNSQTILVNNDFISADVIATLVKTKLMINVIIIASKYKTTD